MKSSGAVLGGLVLAAMAVVGWGLAKAQNAPAWTPPGDVPGIRYVGVAKCSLCHHAAATGDQFGKWSAMDMSHAYERLGSDKAKEFGAARGVQDPQKSPQCLKCHTTGYGLPADRFAPGFDTTKGVQCETCHGPGEKHVRARMAAAFEGDEGEEGPKETPAGEIQRPTPQTCLLCHNEESPGFLPFCFKRNVQKVLHLDPRRHRTDEEMARFRCCGPDGGCAACKHAECSGAAGCEGAGCCAGHGAPAGGH